MADLKKGVSSSMQSKINEIRKFVENNPDIQVLLDNSASWMDGKMESEQKSRATAWRVVAGAAVLTLAAFAIAGGAVYTSLQPTPPPVILLADKTTGHVERLISLKDFQMTTEEATIRRAITTFMRARENYTADTAEDNYWDAAAFMSPQMQAQWAKYWDTANPQSPMNVYKKDGKSRIDIGSITISRNGGNVAMSARVNFRVIMKRGDIVVGPGTSYVATMPFHWVNPATNERFRRVNETGLELLDYMRDEDASTTVKPVPIFQEAPKPAAPPQPAPQTVAMAAPQTAPPPVTPTGAPQ